MVTIRKNVGINFKVDHKFSVGILNQNSELQRTENKRNDSINSRNIKYDDENNLGKLPLGCAISHVFTKNYIEKFTFYVLFDSRNSFMIVL